ncbi:MAG TPA: GPW/gp25 family protein [Allosphingosinicella sp.]
MSNTSGAAIEGDAHLAQSVGDILSTPIGTRIQRRDYGSLLPFLVDQPQTPGWRLQMFAATAIALDRWEPRFRIARVGVTLSPEGRPIVDLEGVRTDRPRASAFTRLSVPLRLGRPTLN